MTTQLGLRLAERGCERALHWEPQDWQEYALFELREFARSRNRRGFTMEQFRVSWLSSGNPQPHDPHVWGALTRLAQRKRIIVATGNYKRAASPATHGHPVMIWIKG